MGPGRSITAAGRAPAASICHARLFVNRLCVEAPVPRIHSVAAASSILLAKPRPDLVPGSARRIMLLHDIYPRHIWCVSLLYRNILARDSANGLLDLSRRLSRMRLPGDEAAEREFDARRKRSHVASGRGRVACVATPSELAFSGDLAAGHQSRRGAIRPIPGGLPGSVQRSGLAPVRSCLPTRPLRSEAWPETNETCPTIQ